VDEILLIFVAIAWAIGTPIIALVALIRTASLRHDNETLRAELAAVRRDLAAKPLPPPFVDESPVLEAPQSVEALAAPVESLPPPFEPEPLPDREPAEAQVPATPSLVPLEATPPKAGWEERLGARAFIWVGAVTLALAAIFLVRYSIEQGYLSPEVRVILAALFGAGLIAGAERMRARDDRVAQGMAAAGVAALYGALLSAVSLYGMISQPMAGVGAAVLTSIAIGLSLRHGIMVAALAFVGGFISPAIIGSEQPNTPVLFGYLLAIAAGTLAVIRHRGWWHLGWGVLAGSALWTWAWVTLQPFDHVTKGPFELHWVGAFQVGIAGLFVWAAWKRLSENENAPSQVELLVSSALGVTGLALAGLIINDHGGQAAGWIALALHGGGSYALGRRAPRFQYAAILGPALSLLVLARWWFTSAGAPAPWSSDHFGMLAFAFGALYAGGAFALMWNAGRPGFWAALSVAAALSHFLLCWWVMRHEAPGTPWGLISIGLAVPFLVAAERLVRWREKMPGATEALGFLAAGVSFFIAAAIPLELNREWITVAYAIELAAIAFIAAKLELVAMRQLCWLLLAVVMIRFVLNPEVLKYPVGVTPVFNWILWGYGISIAALLMGAHYLQVMRNDRLVLATEAAAALLAFVLVTLQIRSLFHRTDMDALSAAFIERACYVAAWGGFALAALWLTRTRPHPVTLWAWRLSGALAAGTAVLVQVLIANPVVAPVDVGSLPILNGLLLAYGVPAAMAVLATRWSDVEADKNVGRLAAGVALVLAFAWVSFEVRYWFDPRFERPGFRADDLELYVYSIAWLLFGVALLVLGFRRDVPALRHAGMGLVCLVVAKVFLIDMAGLQGLLRVASFLGLGVVLMGMGYAYRRYGFAPAEPVKTGT
jgi:uncharacterized membrane protein